MRLVDEMNLAAAFRRQKERLDCKNDCEFEPNVNIWFFQDESCSVVDKSW